MTSIITTHGRLPFKESTLFPNLLITKVPMLYFPILCHARHPMLANVCPLLSILLIYAGTIVLFSCDQTNPFLIEEQPLLYLCPFYQMSCPEDLINPYPTEKAQSLHQYPYHRVPRLSSTPTRREAEFREIHRALKLLCYEMGLFGHTRVTVVMSGLFCVSFRWVALIAASVSKAPGIG